MTSKTIKPTRRCFDDALDFLAATLKERPHEAYRDNFYLVHGILKPRGLKVVRADDHDDLERYSHAWVEERRGAGWLVWNAGLVDGERVIYAVDRTEWEREMGVQEVTRYTIPEAWRENHKSGHYGPWKLKYKRLCADRGTHVSL